MVRLAQGVDLASACMIWGFSEIHSCFGEWFIGTTAKIEVEQQHMARLHESSQRNGMKERVMHLQRRPPWSQLLSSIIYDG